MTGLRRDTLPKAIRDLEAAGLFRVERIFGTGSNYTLTGGPVPISVPVRETVPVRKTVPHQSGKPDHTGTENRTLTRKEPGKNQEREKEKPPTPAQQAKAEQVARFEEFWRAYPRKCSKEKAEHAFTKINPDEQLFAAILRGLELAKTLDHRFQGEKKFTPYAASWLNAKGWTDELQEDPKPATSAAYGQPAGSYGRGGPRRAADNSAAAAEAVRRFNAKHGLSSEDTEKPYIEGLFHAEK
jgi:hypothetical protein